MSEQSGIRLPLPTPEVSESARLRDAAMEYGEYFAIFQLGRNQYDKPADRIPELDRIARSHPEFADRIYLLDSHLERATGIKKGFITSPLPQLDPEPREITANRIAEREAIYPENSSDPKDAWGEIEEVPGDPKLRHNRESMQAFVNFLRRPHARGLERRFPPDYTFASVRHPIARELLDLLNISIAVDDATLNNPEQRADRQMENGKKMVEILIGEEANPHALLRIREIDVLTAVFDGRLRLPESPGKPIPKDRSVEREDFGDNGANNNHY